MPEEEHDIMYYRNLAKSVSERYFDDEVSSLLFLNIVAYFDFDTSLSLTQPTPITLDWVARKRCQEELSLAKYLFEFEGGRVSTDIADETITHIVVNQNDLVRYEKLVNSINRPVKPQFVIFDWVNQCYEEEILLDETSNEQTNKRKQ